INLSEIGFSGCIRTFLPHTRSSQSFTATLKDFGGPIAFNTCPAPTPTNTPTDTPTSTATNTATATNTPTNTATTTPAPPTAATNTPTETATNTPTNTATATNTPAGTVVVPTNTPTHTPVPPTSTNTAVPPTPTNTAVAAVLAARQAPVLLPNTGMGGVNSGSGRMIVGALMILIALGGLAIRIRMNRRSE